MALDLDAPEQLIDPWWGEGPGRRVVKVVRTDSLTSDPLRVLRGVRLISSLDLQYGLEITAAMRVATKKLGLFRASASG